MNGSETRSRREVLAGSLAALVVLATAPACKKEPKAFSCADTTGLTPDEITARTALAYADTTTDPTRACLKCQQFTPAPTDDACGACKVLHGTIHPNGTCKGFSAKA